MSEDKTASNHALEPALWHYLPGAAEHLIAPSAGLGAPDDPSLPSREGTNDARLAGQFSYHTPMRRDRPAYVLYVDDSGTKEYSPTGHYGPGNTRHFVFGGPLMTTSAASALVERIRELKSAAFGTADVEIKSNWLRIQRERERRYLARFGVTAEALDRFVEEYYSLILQADLTFIACVVDKVHMREDYGDRAWYPPAAAYELLIQRVRNEMEDKGATYAVVVDDMSGATPKGRQYRDNLTRHHQQLKQTGSRLWPGLVFPGLGDLFFVDSRRSHLVQVADIAAYNVYRQFRDHGEDWESATLARLPVYDWLAKILKKFRQGPEGRIQGYGVGKIPLRHRRRWGIPEWNEPCR
jgi:Protein of unknown function (DUF3800)